MNPRVTAVLDDIIGRFKTGDIPEAVAMAMFPVANIPSAKWSLLNRTIMFFSGTQDARGFQQWKQADRHVKAGAKAFHILVPFMKTREDQETGEKTSFLSGFGCKPVFRAEDTDGAPLDYEQLEVPDLPLMERAMEWGISVKAIPGNYRYYGYFSSTRREIALATKEEAVFFHELAHAGHEKVKGALKGGQDPLQEIVAELSAQALCQMVGKNASTTLGNSYRYIEGYAKKVNLAPAAACLKVLSETEKVLSLILGKGAQAD